MSRRTGLNTEQQPTNPQPPYKSIVGSESLLKSSVISNTERQFVRSRWSHVIIRSSSKSFLVIKDVSYSVKKKLRI